MNDPIQRLRDALAAHDEWPTHATRAHVVGAARAALRAHDAAIAAAQMPIPPIDPAVLADLKRGITE